MDLQTEQAVWSRVKAPGGVSAEEAVLPERLEALILEEGSLARSLRSLAPRLRGPQKAELQRIAARNESRARSLTTIHYLLTGRRLRLRPPRPSRPGPLPEALREACLQMRQCVRAYEALEKEFSAFEEDFARYSNQSRTDARGLTAFLEQQLRVGQEL